MYASPWRLVAVHVIGRVEPAVQASPPFGLVTVNVAGPGAPVIVKGWSLSSETVPPQVSYPKMWMV